MKWHEFRYIFLYSDRLFKKKKSSFDLLLDVASLAGNKMDAMEELDASSDEVQGFIATRLNQIKRWLLSHSQQLNFFTILVLASVSSKTIFAT